MNNNQNPTKKEVSSLDLENKKREAAAYWKQGFSAGIEFLYNRFYFLTDVIDDLYETKKLLTETLTKMS
jgi:hypothetical protein